jgi:hypothetical protein
MHFCPVSGRRRPSAQHSDRIRGQIDSSLGGPSNIPVVDPTVEETCAKRIAGAGWIDHRERLDVQRKSPAALAHRHTLAPAREDGNLESFVQGENCRVQVIDSRQQFPILESSKDDVRSSERPPGTLDTNILDESGRTR